MMSDAHTVRQPDGDEYKWANKALSHDGEKTGNTHFHTWEEDGSWAFTVTTSVHLDDGGAVKIHENPHTDLNHTEHIHESPKPGTDNIGDHPKQY